MGEGVSEVLSMLVLKVAGGKWFGRGVRRGYRVSSRERSYDFSPGERTGEERCAVQRIGYKKGVESQAVLWRFLKRNSALFHLPPLLCS